MIHLVFLFFVCSLVAFQKVEYHFSNDLIDVVIPCAPKDLHTLEHCIDGIKKNGRHLRRIIVLSKEKFTENAEWFSEDLFPFSMQDVALEIFEGDERAAEEFVSSPLTQIGWIYQQLLKFYAPFVIPNISPNVLILDADVIFLKKTRFLTKEGEPYFIPGKKHYSSNFEHAARLLPDLKQVPARQSGIAHHMVFQKPVLEDLFRLIQMRHQVEPWRAMCRCIDPREIYLACMSEYEIYFNFIQLRSNQAHINPANWAEIHSLLLLPYYRRMEEDVFVACPEWFRKLFGAND